MNEIGVAHVAMVATPAIFEQWSADSSVEASHANWLDVEHFMNNLFINCRIIIKYTVKLIITSVL